MLESPPRLTIFDRLETLEKRCSELELRDEAKEQKIFALERTIGLNEEKVRLMNYDAKR